ncbi:MAG: HAD-IIA family hydrolase [Verrucomicrobia bacterium]|nr:HAD-IIA family hydrolase [Verrucomicrobiota bacterium]
MNQRGYLLDMDGVIYRENHLLPGAGELIAHLLESGTPFLFLTNNSVPTPDDLVVKLERLGIGGLSARHFYTSAMNTADFLAEMHPKCTAFVLGEAGLNAALQEARIPNDSLAPSYVIVGEGTPTTEKIVKAHEFIEKGARLIATNPDYWCPVKSDVTRPGAGALAAYLEASTGRRAYYLGKPNPYMFFSARRLLHRQTHEVMMVGDTMETDIRGAIEIGIQACLVLTGSTGIEDIGDYVYQPTCVMSGVDELLEEIRGSGCTDRLLSPTLRSINLRKTHGSKHHSESPLPRRQRPAMTR